MRWVLGRSWVGAAVVRRWRSAPRDRGMSTAEYAVGMLAAVAFAGVLFKVVTGADVKSLLLAAVKNALEQAG